MHQETNRLHFSQDWGNVFHWIGDRVREETTIPKDWGPSLGNRRASQAMASDRRPIGPNLQEEGYRQQATHLERGKGQGKVKHLAYQADAAYLGIVNG